MKQFIIGFGHRSRVGKDTCAKFLNTELRLSGIMSAQVSFAAKVKEVAHITYGWAGMQPGYFYDRSPEKRKEVLPELGMTPVQVWIEIGNKIREIHGDTWLEACLRGTSTTAQVIIVPDVRFPNEADRILELGGWVYKVNRAGMPVILGVDGQPSQSDEALANYTNWTAVIDNNQDLMYLAGRMSVLAEQVKAKVEA